MGTPLKAHAFAVSQKLFTVERLLPDGEIDVPRGIRGAANRLNRRLIEAGRTPPWVGSADEVRTYWSTRTETATNTPEDYALKDPAIVDLLDGSWQPEVTRDLTVLELGSNAGANLNRLRQLGYSALRAVEINRAAIEAMQRHFPELATDATVVCGPLEDILPTMESASVDVVFTMAVLIHIHPSSTFVFDEIARIARRYVCVVELEAASNTYVFPRNYMRVFESRGLHEIRSFAITAETAPEVYQEYGGYIARLFAAR